jgi:hypothetical protein
MDGLRYLYTEPNGLIAAISVDKPGRPLIRPGPYMQDVSTEDEIVLTVIQEDSKSKDMELAEADSNTVESLVVYREMCCYQWHVFPIFLLSLIAGSS